MTVSSAFCDTDISGSLCNSEEIQSSVAVAAVTQSKHVQDVTGTRHFRVSRGNKFNTEGKTGSVVGWLTRAPKASLAQEVLVTVNLPQMSIHVANDSQRKAKDRQLSQLLHHHSHVQDKNWCVWFAFPQQGYLHHCTNG